MGSTQLTLHRLMLQDGFVLRVCGWWDGLEAALDTIRSNSVWFTAHVLMRLLLKHPHPSQTLQSTNALISNTYCLCSREKLGPVFENDTTCNLLKQNGSKKININIKSFCVCRIGPDNILILYRYLLKCSRFMVLKAALQQSDVIFWTKQTLILKT